MTELALNDVQGHALVDELNRMGVAELVGRKPPAHTRLDGEAVKLEPHTGA